MTKQNSCKVEGCTHKVRAKGLCKKHYAKEYDKKRHVENKQIISEQHKTYYAENKIVISEKNKAYRSKNKEKINAVNKKYRVNNALYYRDYFRGYVKKRRANDLNFRLRGRVSNTIFKALKFMKSNKDNQSILSWLGYSIDELKKHIEKQFEPWMTWENYGKYDSKTWNDSDPTTWKWQIDHIIPQSDLPYSSMEDENFKKCWSLSNIRPLSSKQNQIDGSTRSRHGGEFAD